MTSENSTNKKTTTEKITKIEEEFKNYLHFINTTSWLIKTIKNLNIKFSIITIDIEDIDFIDFDLNKDNIEISNEKQCYFKTKKTAIKFLEKYQTSHEEKIEHIRKKYQQLIPSFDILQISEDQKKAAINLITSTISFKNKNDVLIKTKLNYAIEKININDFESDSYSNSDLEASIQQEETATLLSYLYNENNSPQTKQQFAFCSTKNITNKEQTNQLTKRRFTI